MPSITIAAKETLRSTRTNPPGNQRDLALAYLPGVYCRRMRTIVDDPAQTAELTARQIWSQSSSNGNGGAQAGRYRPARLQACHGR